MEALRRTEDGGYEGREMRSIDSPKVRRFQRSFLIHTSVLVLPSSVLFHGVFRSIVGKLTKASIFPNLRPPSSPLRP